MECDDHMICSSEFLGDLPFKLGIGTSGMLMFCPSTWPRAFNPSRKAASENRYDVGEPVTNQPIRGTFVVRCCAGAASGHAAAAPPSSVMNSRLFIRSPRRPTRAAFL